MTDGNAAPAVKPELVFGLVGAAGTKLATASRCLSEALAAYEYKAQPMRISALLHSVKGGGYLAEAGPEDDRISRHMDAGDNVRRQSGDNSAVAGLAIAAIKELRAEAGEAEMEGTAFVLTSLKHPAEVDALRRVYGTRFLLISVHSPTAAKRDELASAIARSHGEPQRADDYTDAANELMARDEREEGLRHGQDVRGTFTKADVYVSTHPSEDELRWGLGRLLRLFFGDPFTTPTIDEHSMLQAHAAALRSADLSRQVGAAIADARGAVVSGGCNEVPKAHGGQYWESDESDARDFKLGFDSNAKAREDALDTAFEQLNTLGQLSQGTSREDFVAALADTRLSNITEFGRPMHAEMAALLDAAFRGVPVEGCSLFTTTFPCHNCARHIVGSGICEVVYREPYEKSLAGDLHADALQVDPVEHDETKVLFRRFVGLSPTRYFDFFSMPTRKDENGNRAEWTEDSASPRFIGDETAYRRAEEDYVAVLSEAIANVDLSDQGD